MPAKHPNAKPLVSGNGSRYGQRGRMRIAEVRVVHVSGDAHTKRPHLPANEAEFVEVTAENGERGIWGPVRPGIPQTLLQNLRSALIGRSALAFEDCWEALFRAERHGRGGLHITAIGAIDCALWDLRGRMLELPVFELLGGATRNSVPCYATLLGFDPDSDDAPALAASIRDEGFCGQKWALRDGPAEGEAGITRNAARVRRLREAVGRHHPLMFDALGKWTSSYAAAMFRTIHSYDPAYIEEPLPAFDEAGYRKLARMGVVPVAAGEHLYTRFEVARFLNGGLLDVLQPDVAWCGGITEAGRIAALAEVSSTPVIPHGASLLPALHLAMSRSPVVVPAVEYHVTLEPKRQFFYRCKFKPQRGEISLPSTPGLGILLDVPHIESRSPVDAYAP